MSLLLAPLLALGLAPVPAVAGAGTPTAFVEHVSHHRAGTREATAITRWLDGLPDADRRVMEPGTLTVRQRRVGYDALARAGATTPVPLPGSGAPGERITITNELPGGFIETWTFQRVSGRRRRWLEADRLRDARAGDRAGAPAGTLTGCQPLARTSGSAPPRQRGQIQPRGVNY